MKPGEAALAGRCEEASPLSGERYIPCNAPAVSVVRSAKDRRDYRMCGPCADHNIRNRGMTWVEPFLPAMGLPVTNEGVAKVLEPERRAAWGKVLENAAWADKARERAVAAVDVAGGTAGMDVPRLRAEVMAALPGLPHDGEPWPDPARPHDWPRDVLTVADCWPPVIKPGATDAESLAEEGSPLPIRVRFAGRVRGFIGESGLRATCPDCHRFLERAECRLHGKVKGAWVLKVKCRVALDRLTRDHNATGDEGEDIFTGRDRDDTAVVVLWGAAAMNAGRTRAHEMDALKQAHTWAKEAMSPDVVGPRLEHDLMGISDSEIEGYGWLVPVHDNATDAPGWALVVGEAFTATSEELR